MNLGVKHCMKQMGKLPPNFKDNFFPIIINKATISLHRMIGSIVASSELVAYFNDKKEQFFFIGYTTDDDLRQYAVLVKVVQKLIMPDKTTRVVYEGLSRIKIVDVNKDNEQWLAKGIVCEIDEETEVLNVLQQELKLEFSNVNVDSSFTQDVLQTVNKSKDLEETFSRILYHINSISTNEKVDLFCMDDHAKRIETLLSFLLEFSEKDKIKKEIHGRVKNRINTKNREFYLQEQIKEINGELNGGTDANLGDVESRLANLNLSVEAKEKVKKILLHVKKLPPMAPEAAALRTYLENFADLPWGVYSTDNKSLLEAEEILNKTHFALDKAKEYILDFIAVKKIAPMAKGVILCLVGPPGVGKTSLCRSIADALGRDFVRISLGGLKDESEIRGHSRTYLHSLPGKIIQNMQKSKTANPVFLLDEIDKISSNSHRGDPSSALLEVLDPEQNSAFTDTYLEVAFDLSQVLFITTANTTNDIPVPLQDRMEIIKLSGYTEKEKMSIVDNFLINKQLKENGLEGSKLVLTDEAKIALIKNYTLESGVRSLEREVSRLIRKIITQNLLENKFENQEKPFIDETIDKNSLLNRLGKVKYDIDDNMPLTSGMALGLAWTSYGGLVMPIEAFFTKGSGKIDLTGKLGDVMKESAQIAYSFVKIYLEKHDVDTLKLLEEKDLHLHAIEGAVPKDGPSAGITMASAIYSSITGKKLKNSIAMTGELTLSGQILGIGGLKEKALAAHRYGIEHLVLSSRNKRDLDEIPSEVLKELNVHFFDSAYDAFEFIFNY